MRTLHEKLQDFVDEKTGGEVARYSLFTNEWLDKNLADLPKKMHIERESDISYGIDTVVEVLKEGKDKDFFIALKKIADDHLE